MKHLVDDLKKQLHESQKQNLCILLYMYLSAVLSTTPAATLWFWEFNNDVCHAVKVTRAESSPWHGDGTVNTTNILPQSSTFWQGIIRC